MTARPLINVKPRDAVDYVFMPGIWPRVQGLFLSGLHHLAYIIALTYQVVRLLPDTHPYVQPRNIGRFGLIDVLAVTANRIVLKRENFDQIILFFVVLMSLVLVALYVAGTALTIWSQPALAQALPPLPSIFATPNPGEDLAFIMMNKVFGIPGIFGDAAIEQKPVHMGLHAILAFYSKTIMLLAFLIFLYYLVTTVFEVTQTGKPLGQQFNKIWAPLRLIAAFGLLVPISAYGLNSAQYIVLYSAKLGSGFATNAWTQFVRQTANTYALAMPEYKGEATISREKADEIDSIFGLNDPDGDGPKTKYDDPFLDDFKDPPINGFIVVDPEVPNAFPILEFINSFWVCKLGYETLLDGRAPDNPVIPKPGFTPPAKIIRAYVVRPGSAPLLLAADNARGHIPFNDPADANSALVFSGGRNIVIRLGVYDPAAYPDELGSVKPFCGEMTIPVSHATTVGASALYEGFFNVAAEWLTKMSTGHGSNSLVFAERINRVGLGAAGFPGNPAYANTRCPYNPTPDHWTQPVIDQALGNNGHEGNIYLLHDQTDFSGNDGYVFNTSPYAGEGSTSTLGNCLQAPPKSDIQDGSEYDMGYRAVNIGYFEASMEGTMTRARRLVSDDKSLRVDAELQKLGWVSAGITAQKMARVNGALIAAALHIPYVSKHPQAMEIIKEAKLRNNRNVDVQTLFEPRMAQGSLSFPMPGEEGVANALYANYRFWRDYNDGASETGSEALSGNAIIDAISSFLGFQSLIQVACNRDLHPVAYLSAIGRALVEKGIYHFMISTGAAGIGGIASGMMVDTIGVKNAGALRNLGGFFVMIASIGLAAGFVMYYIIPFLPFMYFFFAFGTWVKTVFEAMAAVPLWALAHMQIDGKGLPAQKASAGYFLVLEIFLRPFLTTIGFIAAMTIFASMTYLLNMMMPIYGVGLFGDSAAAAECGKILDENRQGMDMARHAIDQLFFTVLYVILVYMVGLSSFKLIDMIPDKIMRWMGSQTSSFGEFAPDTESQFVGYTIYSANTVTQGAVEGVNTAVSGLSDSIGRMGRGNSP